MLTFEYAEFIVPAFAITGLVFVVMVAASVQRARHWKRRFEELSGR